MEETTEQKNEIKQTNFRIGTEAAGKFRKFCEENGMNQAQGFDHMIQVLELNKAKSAIPSRSSDIEEFEMHSKAMLRLYTNALENGMSARALAMEEFRSALGNKDDLIADLQKRLSAAEAAQSVAEKALEAAGQTAKQADREAKQAGHQADMAQALADERGKMIAALTEQLTEARKKADGYDALKEETDELKVKLMDAEKEAELAQVKAHLLSAQLHAMTGNQAAPDAGTDGPKG